MKIPTNIYKQINRPFVLPILALTFAITSTPPLYADIYKCVDTQGHQSFSSRPCRMEKPMKPNNDKTKQANNQYATNNSTNLSQQGEMTEDEERALLFAVDGKIRELQKKIDRLQRERAKEIAAADRPEATHSSVYRQQSEIRTRFDTVIASELDTISQLRKKRQVLIQKIM